MPHSFHSFLVKMTCMTFLTTNRHLSSQNGFERILPSVGTAQVCPRSAKANWHITVAFAWLVSFRILVSCKGSPVCTVHYIQHPRSPTTYSNGDIWDLNSSGRPRPRLSSTPPHNKKGLPRCHFEAAHFMRGQLVIIFIPVSACANIQRQHCAKTNFCLKKIDGCGCRFTRAMLQYSQ